MSSNDQPHGAIDQAHLNRKTDYLFRISLKCIVRNEKGEILVVKESGRTWWDLPGGGMDHGEDIGSAIAREMKEEVNLEGSFTYKTVYIDEPHHLRDSNVLQIRVVFLVEPDNMHFEPGEDGDQIAFMKPEDLPNINLLTVDYARRYVPKDL